MRSGIKRILTASLFSTALVCGAQSASAALWDIVGALPGAPGSGFGASLFHESNNPDPRTASNSERLDDFTSFMVTGEWNDVTGAFTADFTDNVSKSFTLATRAAPNFEGLFFDGTGFMEDDTLMNPIAHRNGFAQLQIQNVNGLDTQIIEDSILTFLDGIQCCSGPAGDRPNSFGTLPGDMFGFMTLWGATEYNGTVDGNLSDFNDVGSRFGIDMRLELTKQEEFQPVPVPAALPLFAGGLGLLGFLGWRRRRTAGVAA